MTDFPRYYYGPTQPFKVVEKFFGEVNTSFSLGSPHPEQVTFSQGAKIVVREEYYLGAQTRCVIYSDGFVDDDVEPGHWGVVYLKNFPPVLIQGIEGYCTKL